jgi:anti-anti-sigma factor
VQEVREAVSGAWREDMKIPTRREDGVLVLEPRASLVGRSVGDLGEAVSRALEQEPGDVAIDMKSVAMVDSGGLEELLRAHERCAAIGAVCRIVNATPKIKNILRVTRLDRELTVA